MAGTTLMIAATHAAARGQKVEAALSAVQVLQVIDLTSGEAACL